MNVYVLVEDIDDGEIYESLKCSNIIGVYSSREKADEKRSLLIGDEAEELLSGYVSDFDKEIIEREVIDENTIIIRHEQVSVTYRIETYELL